MFLPLLKSTRCSCSSMEPRKRRRAPAVLSREAWDPKHYNSGHQVQHHPDQQIQLWGLQGFLFPRSPKLCRDKKCMTCWCIMMYSWMFCILWVALLLYLFATINHDHEWWMAGGASSAWGGKHKFPTISNHLSTLNTCCMKFLRYLAAVLITCCVLPPPQLAAS